MSPNRLAQFCYACFYRKVLILLEVSVIQRGAGTSRFGEPVQFDEKTAAKGGGANIQNSRPSVQQSSGLFQIIYFCKASIGFL